MDIFSFESDELESVSNESTNNADESADYSDEEFNVTLFDKDLENLANRLSPEQRARHQISFDLPPHEEYLEHERTCFEEAGLSLDDPVPGITLGGITEFLVMGFEHGFSVGYLMADIDNFPDLDKALTDVETLNLDLDIVAQNLEVEKQKVNSSNEELDKSKIEIAKLHDSLSWWKVLSLCSFGAFVFLLIKHRFADK